MALERGYKRHYSNKTGDTKLDYVWIEATEPLLICKFVSRRIQMIEGKGNKLMCGIYE